MSKKEFEKALLNKGLNIKEISELTNSLVTDNRVNAFDYVNYIDNSEAESILRK